MEQKKWDGRERKTEANRSLTEKKNNANKDMKGIKDKRDKRIYANQENARLNYTKKEGKNMTINLRKEK